MPNKPTVITAVQVLLWISVASSAVLTCLLASAPATPARLPAGFHVIMVVTIIVMVATAILNAVIAVQLGLRRNWARITGLTLAVIGATWTGITMLVSTQPDISSCISVMFNIGIIACLGSQQAKDWCAN